MPLWMLRVVTAASAAVGVARRIETPLRRRSWRVVTKERRWQPG
jgi:hypothetical protein